MTATDLMGRYADVLHAVDGLLQSSRQLRDRSTAPTEDNLKQIEDGLFMVGHDLVQIAADLRAAVLAVDINQREAINLLSQCGELLARTRAYARPAPAESFSTDRFDVGVDAGSQVVVVREKAPETLPTNVTPVPTGLARAIYCQGRTPGGAA